MTTKNCWCWWGAVVVIVGGAWLRAAATDLPVVPRVGVHSHNDYEQARPLVAALEHGFTSIEADIWLIEGELYVSHDRPTTLDPARTLTRLYLEPLAARIRTLGGGVFPGYRGAFFLMIDFKTESAPTYRRLKDQLESYRAILATSGSQRGVPSGPVTVVLSGNKGRRPFYDVISEGSTTFTLDGTPDELGLGIPAAVCPLVSAPYSRFLSWSGSGKVLAAEREKFQGFVKQVHAEGKRVRIWAVPADERVWSWLLEAGMDILNVDDLDRAAGFLDRRGSAQRN